MAETQTHEHTNRLIDETSPYLLQHAHNPVDWYPWGPEALKAAKREDKLILLSIGYSACHWCHVMERESFENEAIAALMNRHFVNVKVDREERPDLDDIYMAATVAMNHGQGGWPMTVFLTPDLEPVYAGTYFPPDDGYSRIGFPRLLTEISSAWERDPDGVRGGAADIVEHLRRSRDAGPALAVGDEELRSALEAYATDFDPHYGGFGPAPKFPPAVGLMLLLRLHRRFGDQHALEMVRKTLDGMAQGGMYDHIGGGFCRYSTDAHWLVPHFEKMLYDNALLTRAYLEAFQVTGDQSYRRVATEVLEYVLREMTSPEGGFYSSTDADSEGVEGKFFVWTPDEIGEIVGEQDARLFNAYYDITDRGNWEGKSILHVRRSYADVARQFELPETQVEDSVERSRALVYQARLRRVRPGLDDKILTAWNGMMIGAFAEGYRVLRDARYRDAAIRAADFVLGTLRQENGRLFRTTRGGKAHLNAYLEDYAHLAEGLLDLYEATGVRRYLTESGSIAEAILRDFGSDDGALYHTSREHERLPLRYRDGADGATPAPNAVAASVLIRLSFHFDRSDLRAAGVAALKAYGRKIARFPRAFAKSLISVDLLLDGPVELAVVGRRDAADREAIEREIGRAFLPNRIEALGDPDDVPGFDDLPLLSGKRLADGHAALYVCRNYACAAPVTDPEEVRAALLERDPAQATARRAGIALRRSGHATAEGTARFASRHGADRFAALGATGLNVSRLGFGAYRVDDAAPVHHEALTRAILSGINLIDTSSNYGDGGSERLVGRVANELVEAEDVWRDEIVVVSKVGYIQGSNLAVVRRRHDEGRGFPEVVVLDDQLQHCIHPEFLDDQLQRTLERLELETVDVLLLHNPEYFLDDANRRGAPLEEARREFYRRIENAFRFLEAQVDAGALSWYGVSSNTLASRPDDPSATSLPRFLDAAQAAGASGHHFAVVQFPLNLLESAAVLKPHGEPETGATLLDLTRENDLAVLINRPLNAFGGSGMVRLADVTIDAEELDLQRQAQTVGEMETAFRNEIAPNVHVPEGAMNPRTFFNWADQLVALGAQALSLDQWAQAASQVQLSVARIAQALDEGLQGETRAQWIAWRDRYFVELGRLLGELRRQAAVRAAATTSAIVRAIDPLLPADRRSAPLSRKALWVTASTPGVTSVLNGMRTPEYVIDSTSILEWPALEAVEPVYSAAARSMGA